MRSICSRKICHAMWNTLNKCRSLTDRTLFRNWNWYRNHHNAKRMEIDWSSHVRWPAFIRHLRNVYHHVQATQSIASFVRWVVLAPTIQVETATAIADIPTTIIEVAIAREAIFFNKNWWGYVFLTRISLGLYKPASILHNHSILTTLNHRFTLMVFC
jgi:hypothetical protein